MYVCSYSLYRSGISTSNSSPSTSAQVALFFLSYIVTGFLPLTSIKRSLSLERQVVQSKLGKPLE